MINYIITRGKKMIVKNGQSSLQTLKTIGIPQLSAECKCPIGQAYTTWGSLIECIPYELKRFRKNYPNYPVCNRHPRIGLDVPWNDDGVGIGDPAAIYQIPVSKKFVQETQYRALPLDDEKLQVILNMEPKPLNM